MEPFIGQIIPVGFNFAPYGWLLCQGQLISIANYSTLYNLIGTSYGGDGQTTFGIPNLSGRVPLHYGQGPTLSTYTLGEAIGTESVTLLATQAGAHTHSFMTSTKPANSITPSNTTTLGLASSGTGGIYVYGSSTTSNTKLSSKSIGIAGGSLPHENRQPFQAVNYIIAWSGLYPSRN
jgi:microcystin-dependent protein